MKILILGFILIVFSATQAFSKARTIRCSTPRELKTFTIKDKAISLHKKERGREIASSQTIGVRTKYSNKGFTKITFEDGIKHTIHIEDKNNFSNVSDYLSVKSKMGHEMTYPINCRWEQ